MKPIFTALFVTATTLALGSAALAEPDASGRKISTSLNGASEAPGPGDDDGTGTFTARINPGQEEICYELVVNNIDAAAAAHIHKAPPGSAGPVSLGLTAPTSGNTKECKAIPRDLAMAIIQDPQDYYVNVHNASFPPGAVRGQLMKGN
jgi:CHRD domain